MNIKLLFLKTAFVIFTLFLFTKSQAQVLYTKVLVSDSGTTNTLGSANTSKNIAVAPNGMIGVVYVGNAGVRFAKSVNRGQSFLPSVKLSSATSGEAEINLAANGNIYVVHSNKIYVSTDEGNTFTSNTFTNFSVSFPHVTSYGDNVYVSSVGRVFRNFNNGLDTFYNYLIPGSFAYADIFADPATGNVFVPADNPTIFLNKSVTQGDTFVNIPVTPTKSVYYSSYVLSYGNLGSYLFAAGGPISSGGSTDGLKFDLGTGTNASLTYGSNTGATDRTLAADDLGDLVDGYKSGTKFAFRVSKTFGSSFDTTQYLLDSALNHNIAINTFTQDVVRAYTGTNGKIYIDVLQGLLLPRTVVLPTITTFGTLNPFSKCGSNASAAQSFRVKGVDLNKNLIVKAPAGMQVSLNSSSGFDSTLTLIPNSGKVDSVLVYVRLGANASGNITGKIACTSIGAVTKYLDITGSVSATPSISVSSIADIYSNQTSFNIPYTATTGSPDQYSISTSSPNIMSGFVPVVNASLSTSPIVVNVPASSPNTYNFNLSIRNSNTGCSNQNIELNLKVVLPPTAPPTVITSGASLITATSAQLGGNVTYGGTEVVTERGIVYSTNPNPTIANTKIAMGNGDGVYSQVVTGLSQVTTYHVRAYAINSVGTSYGADSTFTTDFIPPPTLSLIATFDPFVTCVGAASSPQQFTVSGLNLTGNITVSAPTGFEVSTTMTSGFASSLILSATSGTVSATTLYIRISNTATGTPSGNLSISSNGAATQNQNINATLNQVPSSPIISIQAASPVCKGAQYLNFGASTAPASGVSYQWSATNANLYAQGSTKQYSLISFPNAGVAVVTLTASQNGCSSSTSVNINVNAEQAPTATVRYFNKNFVCEANKVQKYQWGYDDLPSLKGNIIQNEINQNYFNASPETATKAYWVISNNGNCYQKTYHAVPLSTTELIANELGIEVYPNPFSSQINIRSNRNLKHASIKVLDLNGRSLSTESMNGSDFNMNLDGLAAGIYLLHVEDENGLVSTTKIIKH
ncbi:MAG: T9SS type A sorting domain-containing protein [Bacteroidia bacterium]